MFFGGGGGLHSANSDTKAGEEKAKDQLKKTDERQEKSGRRKCYKSDYVDFNVESSNSASVCFSSSCSSFYASVS